MSWFINNLWWIGWLTLTVVVMIITTIKFWGSITRIASRVRGIPRPSAAALAMIWKLIRWLVVIAVAVFLVITCRSGCSQSQSAKIQAQEQKIAQLSYALAHAEEVELEKEYVADIDAIPGHSIGNNYDGPLSAQIIRRENDKFFWFDVHFKEYGRAQIMRVRLVWNGEMWDGPYEQDDPPDHGYISIKKVAPEAWSGTLTDKEGTICIYNLYRK